MKMFISYIFFTMSGLVMMKLGGGELVLGFKNGILQVNIGLKIILALLLYVTSFLIWTQIVAKSDLSYIMPLSSAIVNILSIVVGILIFKETISTQQTIGIVVTIVGVVLMNLK